MKKTQQAVQDYYNFKLQKETDFENALKECNKDDLIDFIMTMQCRGAFNGICY